MKKQTQNLILFLFITANCLTYSQNSFIASVVEEDTSKAVGNAIVSIEETALAQTTNNNGEFSFNNTIPNGEYVVTVAKEGYITEYLLIDFAPGKNIEKQKIKIEVNKSERKRRDKIIKQKKKDLKKREKEKEEKIKKAQKEKEKREKELKKKKKKLKNDKKKNKDIYTEELETTEETTTVTAIDANLQNKYGTILNIDPSNLTNAKLYEFIELWTGTPYNLGGETKDGIDCSSFTQRLYTKVYDTYIERTAEKQFKSKNTDKFQGKEFLHEGDLVFFKGSGENSDIISHVGIYLHNGKFVHATSYTKDTGSNGVKISDLNNAFWSRKFVAGGRRISN